MDRDGISMETCHLKNSNRQWKRERKRKKESGKSTDGPSYNTSVPIELSEKMNNDDMEKTIKYSTK